MAELTLSDGETLYYEVQGTGPPLALVTGLGGLASFWAPHVAALSERFTVILHDHRGTGRSSHSAIRYSVGQMADDLLQLLDRLDIGRAHLVGHSTGGAIGQTLALDRPERVGRLVLSSSWAGADAYFRRLFAVRAEVLRASGTAAYLRASSLFMCPPVWIRDTMARLEESEAAALALAPPPEVVLSRIEAILAFERRAELGRIAAPTLVTCATDDQITPHYFSEELARRIPGAALALAPYGGHFYPAVMAEDFRRTVVAFLTRDEAS